MKRSRIEKDIIRKIKQGGKLSKGKRIIINLVLFFVLIGFLFPIIWIFLISFKNQNQISSMPPDVYSSFTLDNYKDIFSIRASATDSAKDALMRMKSINFFKSILNTILLSTASVFFSLLVGVPAAYGLSR